MGGSRQPAYRPHRRYVGQAMLTLLLHYLRSGIVGVIVSLLFLIEH